MYLVPQKFRGGYTLLITVLVTGIITSSAAIAILMLGLSIERNAYSLQISSQTYEFTMSCAELAIDRLRQNLEYGGNEEITIDVAGGYAYGYGNTATCIIRPITGFWNNDRTVCVESTYGDYTKRRQEIQIARVLPDTSIRSWQEVNNISLCTPYIPGMCGDSSIGGSEECDTGGDSATCNNNCTIAACGDGYTNASYIVPDSGIGEQCDTEGQSLTCDDNCTLASCGDGDVNTVRGETCDSSGVNTALCDTDCTVATCGDGFINAVAGETCDGNGAGTGGETAVCDTNCTVRACGDGTVNVTAGETCDDGNLTNGDGCTSTCIIQVSYEPTDYRAYWRLDQSAAGSNAIDSGSGGFTCTPSGGATVSTNVPTQINVTNSTIDSTYSRDFDGVNDFLTCGNSTTLSPSPISVSLWVRSDVTTVSGDGILCATPGNSNWGLRGWGFTFEGSTSVSFFVQNWWNNYARATSITTTNWNHIVGMWDGTTISIYVNGTLRGTDTFSGSMTNNNTVQMGRCGRNTNNFDGKVDDVRIFNRILTSNEITALATGT